MVWLAMAGGGNISFLATPWLSFTIPQRIPAESDLDLLLTSSVCSRRLV